MPPFTEIPSMRTAAQPPIQKHTATPTPPATRNATAPTPPSPLSCPARTHLPPQVGGVVIPATARVYGQLVQCPLMSRMTGLRSAPHSSGGSGGARAKVGAGGAAGGAHAEARVLGVLSELDASARRWGTVARWQLAVWGLARRPRPTAGRGTVGAIHTLAAHVVVHHVNHLRLQVFVQPIFLPTTQIPTAPFLATFLPPPQPCHPCCVCIPAGRSTKAARCTR